MFIIKYIIFLFIFLSVNLSYAINVTLQWDSNTESDLAGYKAYYDSDDSSPPYNGTGSTQGTSPIKIPITSLTNKNIPEFTFNNLDATKNWFFSVTAYDTENLESDYSNIVAVLKALSNVSFDPISNILSWSICTSPKLKGYKIHFSNTSGTAPYTYSGTPLVVNGIQYTSTPINIPITTNGFNPLNPSVVITRNVCKNWFFRITSYADLNDSGVITETDYSNELAITEMCAPSPPTSVKVSFIKK